MKKKILFILALAAMLSACKIKLSENTGTVVIDFGNSGRALGSNGLPELKDSSMSLEIISPSKGTQTVPISSGKEKKWSGSFPIGEKIGIKVALSTALAEWKGSAEHTVTAGVNTVAVKLSKTPKSVENILIDVNSAGDEVNIKLAGGKELLANIETGSNNIRPIIARDGIGRIYVLYEKRGLQFTRFDVEGKEDLVFETAIKSLLPFSGTSASPSIRTMTVDPKTNTIFIVDRAKQIYAVKETAHNCFTCSNAYNLNSLSIGSAEITAVAAYKDALFLTARASHTNNLIACEAELSDSETGLALRLTEKTVKQLPKLRTDTAFSNNFTECTGLFADENYIYCLLKEQSLHNGNLYALGQLVRYTGSTLTGETMIGLHPKAGTDTALAFDDDYFSNPIGFIGYDEENLYIADDGINIEELNENLHVNGSKNRIAAFKRKEGRVSFSGTEVTWYEQKPEYKFPDTKILLWDWLKPDCNGKVYWISDEAGTWLNDVWVATIADDYAPTDVFCYDQDGNLYIQSNYSGYTVRRFALKEDGTYDVDSAQDLDLQTSDTIAAIAVDISNGKNYLYYANTLSSPHTIKRFEWGQSGHKTFSTADQDTNYSISTPLDEQITAIAANKDGVFVAVNETYQDGSIPKYRLKVQKYKKSDGTPDGELTLVDDAAVYKDMSGNPINDSTLPHGDNYREFSEVIDGLQVVDNVLYGISSKSYQVLKKGYGCETFKNSGILYKIGNTAEPLSASSLITKEKPADDTNKIGYGFYRFIAVKPKKLVIASDGGWGDDGLNSPPPVPNNKDTVFECDLSSMILNEGKQSDGSFSHTLGVGGSGFEW